MPRKIISNKFYESDTADKKNSIVWAQFSWQCEYWHKQGYEIVVMTYSAFIWYFYVLLSTHGEKVGEHVIKSESCIL